MSKSDDDPQSDLEAGMTTAERRRRRRRGGGLRVPSDNVPRRTTPPVVAPVPEDPSLAMSIAYSFSNDGSEPVARVDHEAPRSPRGLDAHAPGFEPVAPDAVPTVIDPPSEPVEHVDFETQTREMTAVDLAALGLEDPSARGAASGNAPAPQDAEPGAARTVELDIDVDDAASAEDAVPTVVVAPGTARPPRARTDPGVAPPVRAPRERLSTVALSEEDLEEVRERAQAHAARAVPTPTAPARSGPVTVPRTADGKLNATQPLTALDIEVASDGERSEPLSVPEIDIAELAELADRADSSGEIDVDVDDEPHRATPPAVTTTPPPVAAPTERRSRPPSVPPVVMHAPAAGATPATPAAPAAAAGAPAASAPGQPPPRPVQAKVPPTPPPKAPPKPAATVAAVAPAPAAAQPKLDGKPPRSKAWYVDLFDEDYLRTLPFLTPQATQAEAEFVIDALGLQPGAQVLDVGCGYGRHAMELAARGFHVVGLDLSTPLLVRGGEEAMRRGLEINFVRGDMRELDFDAQFDGAYCVFSTFGYFDDETNKKTISNMARALKPGGRVMIEILNRDYLIADLPTRVWWEGEGCVVLEEVELNYFSSRIQVNRSVVFDDGRQLEQEISVRAYSLHEIGKLMHAAGFRVLEVSGGYHTRGRFFGNQSRHIIVLAERKDPAGP